MAGIEGALTLCGLDRTFELFGKVAGIWILAFSTNSVKTKRNSPISAYAPWERFYSIGTDITIAIKDRR